MSSDPVEMARWVSGEYDLGWDDESILQLFSEYIRNQSDNGALLDFLETAASAERDESENNWGGAG